METRLADASHRERPVKFFTADDIETKKNEKMHIF